SWKTKLLSVPVNESANCLQLLLDLATLGLLRAYTLRCDGQPCAMGLGYQANGVYHYYETAYNQQYATLSPGGVLLYLMIEDLIKSQNRPAKMSFGSGEMAYKEWFANSFQEDVAVLLLKKNMTNRFLSCAHGGVRALARMCRVITRAVERFVVIV